MPFLDKDGCARLWKNTVNKIRSEVNTAFEDVPEVYVQNDEPLGVGDGALWLDMDGTMVDVDKDTVIFPSTAEVGQLLSVETVDASGKPTGWKAVDAYSGDKWELIDHVVVEEDVKSFDLNFAKAYKSLRIAWKTVAGSGTNYWVKVKPADGEQFYFSSAANSTRYHSFEIKCYKGYYNVLGLFGSSQPLVPFQKGTTVNLNPMNAGMHYIDKQLSDEFTAVTGITLRGSTYSVGTELYVYGIPA